MNEDERKAFGDAVTLMAELAKEGEFAKAVRVAASFPFNEEEISAVEEAGYFEASGHYVLNLLSVFQQLRKHQGPTVDDPSALASIAAPVLVLYGAETKPFWVRSAQHVAVHVPDSSIQKIPNAGHAAPITNPAASQNHSPGFSRH